MKARLPQGYGGGGASNLQQIARQAQKLQEEMDQVTKELEAKEYSATAGGDAVKATVTGKMEVKSIQIKPEVVDPEDVEMLSDLVIASVNEALRAAIADKNERMEAISGGLSVPGFI
ncbi:MAG: YbaB/EbfC family nucleoid-associated protein [Ruminococcaceae bacterium]|nr:YbaB/EbfC family nucleoid-associated protein [Oscillospiraceae bacterium]